MYPKIILGDSEGKCFFLTEKYILQVFLEAFGCNIQI
jgi:hypothetical protein